MAWCASLYLERVNEFATFDPNVKVASLGKVGQQPFSFVHCERRLQGGFCGGDLAVSLYDFEQLPLAVLLRTTGLLPASSDAAILMCWA